jgi:SAM-dependent methyltransferase
MSESELDDAGFHQFEHAGWQRAAEHYGEAFGALTTQAAEPLLDAAGVRAGARVLDVACGPGMVSAAAQARGADVVGVDFSAAMIARARATHPHVRFEEGDAEALQLASSSFDAVVMNFGLLHLARPDHAIAEGYRVLRSGGRYAFTVWDAPERAVGFRAVLDAVDAYGRADVGLPEGPPFFRFSAADQSRRALEDAGFTGVDVRTVPLVWRLSSADGVFDALAQGGVRTAALLRAQTPESLARIRSAVRASVETYRHGSTYEVPMPAILVSAMRP